MGTLQNTMKLNTSLMQDLSKKSEALTNRLIPRNPIAPKNKKYPTHSEFGYKPQPTTNRYNDLLLSKKNESGFSKRYRAGQRNSMAGGSESMTLDPDQLMNLHGFPSQTPHPPNQTVHNELSNKMAHVPFHQKRQTLNPEKAPRNSKRRGKDHHHQLTDTISSTHYDTTRNPDGAASIDAIAKHGNTQQNWGSKKAGGDSPQGHS